jgi:hypothetical protein
VIARFDEFSGQRHPSNTPESGALVDRICVLARVENRAAAEQLVAIGELFAYRLSRCSKNEDWAHATNLNFRYWSTHARRLSSALRTQGCGVAGIDVVGNC